MNALANDLSVMGNASRAFLGVRHEQFIDGRFVAGSSGEVIPVIDPTSGSQVASVPAGNASDVDQAVGAARRAFERGPWPKMRGPDRERLLLRLADLLESQSTE